MSNPFSAVSLRDSEAKRGDRGLWERYCVTHITNPVTVANRIAKQIASHPRLSSFRLRSIPIDPYALLYVGTALSADCFFVDGWVANMLKRFELKKDAGGWRSISSATVRAFNAKVEARESGVLCHGGQS